MSSFIPNLANHTALLRNNLKRKCWLCVDFITFKSLFFLVHLVYLDKNKHIVLHIHASTKGFSAALFQNNKPIAFASKALTPAAIRYANAERELLAVVYGCQKFHSYLYERLFVVRTDPLSLRTDPDAIKHVSSKSLVASTTVWLCHQKFSMKRNGYSCDALTHLSHRMNLKH